MSLRARVKKVTGAVRHYEGNIVEGEIKKGDTLPSPAFVELVEAEGGFLILQFDEAGNGITDSWQATLADAKEQAKMEFDIDDSDWIEE